MCHVRHENNSVFVDSPRVMNNGEADGHDEPFVEHDEVTSPRSELLISPALDGGSPAQSTLSTPVNSSPAPGSSHSTCEIPASGENVEGDMATDNLSAPPSTSHISGVSEDVKGECICPISSYEQLHGNNRLLDEQIQKWPKDVRESFRQRVLEISARFLGEQGENTIDDWNYVKDPEELFQEIAPSFTQYFHATIRSVPETSPLHPILFGGALECVMGAFLWDNYRRDFWCHGMDGLQGTSHDLHLGVYQVTEAIHQRAVDEEFDERGREYASPDEDKEGRADLSPAEKTRVFRNALSARNKVGWIFYDQTHRTDQIRVTRTGLALLHRVFEHNPDTSPADLLRAMDLCTDAFRNQPAPKTFRKGVNWHTRMGGNDLWCFVMYLKAIVRDLGISKPVEMFLGDIEDVEEEESEELMAA